MWVQNRIKKTPAACDCSLCLIFKDRPTAARIVLSACAYLDMDQLNIQDAHWILMCCVRESRKTSTAEFIGAKPDPYEHFKPVFFLYLFPECLAAYFLMSGDPAEKQYGGQSLVWGRVPCFFFFAHCNHFVLDLPAATNTSTDRDKSVSFNPETMRQMRKNTANLQK